MKQFFLIVAALVAIATGAKADVEINSTNFPDDNFRNYLLAQDYGRDGVLTNSEIANIKDISVRGKGIWSLGGIEHFTALVYLNCEYNKLRFLDLSKNTKLERLTCNNNQLIALDLLKNTKLIDLQCSKNMLTELDLSKNTALRYLFCAANQLTALDLSKNTKLYQFECLSNRLTELDVSKNTALGLLYCSGNHLTALDVSKNTALTNLDCRYNQLNTLNLSKNTKLLQLYCNNNQLTELDLSKNTALYLLYCERNRLTALDLSKNTKLERCICYHNNIFGDNMDALIASLPSYSNSSTEIELFVVDNDADEGNYFSAAQAEAAKAKGWTVYWNVFGERKPYEDGIAIYWYYFHDSAFQNALLNLPYGRDGKFVWEELHGTNFINVNDKGIEDLDGIKYFTRLTSLVCGYNKLTELEVPNPKLKDLFCAANRLTSIDVSGNPELETLDCAGNKLTYIDVSENTKLKELNCAMNKITDRMDSLIASLPMNNDATVEHKFYVKYNDPDEGNVITAEQMAAVKARGWTPYCYNGTAWESYSDIIAIDSENFPDDNFRNYLLAQDYGKDGLLTDGEIKAIKSLNVSNQNIKRLKGIEFFYALTTLTCRSNQLTNLDVSKNAALTGLYCSDNPLTALDVSKNTALESLECDNNQLTALDVSNNTALTSLHCVNNQLTALDVSKNTALTSLSCFNNDLTALDVSNNKALTGLYCHQNQIKGDRMEALVASLPKNTTNDIHYFYVNYNTSDEGNVITEEQVAAAKVKGWTVYWYNGKDWEPYEVSYAINEKNFPDAAFRNYLLAQDYGKDGKITEDEIQTVNWINVEEKGIKTLKGVEFFTALTSLYCSDNQLTELDLSMNTKLSTLWCQRNQLIKLDVSNTALTQLQCYMNQLKGKNMDAFIAGLPINTDEEFPYYLFVYKKSPNEGNVMTKAQVAAATARGWTVMMYWENGDMDLYEGIALMGDVNDDGAVDVADIATVIDVMAGKAPEYKDKADVNNDKTVDVADIATIIDIMAGKDVEP
ncbi:MAG: leucine-rich repeat domain-containing protein [Prevotella sp.]|nr:leucine-rich repeat domain-containing protein [Prevotella sp.]